MVPNNVRICAVYCGMAIHGALWGTRANYGILILLPITIYCYLLLTIDLLTIDHCGAFVVHCGARICTNVHDNYR